jgi:hypothetical protein
MNRRSFLLAVGATACGHAPLKPRRPANTTKPTPSPTEPAVNQDLSLRSSQLRASAIALHGAAGFVAISDRHVVLAGPDHALLAWNAANGRPVG